jgi:crotonobetaine/carnitine-CoA ligase
MLARRPDSTVGEIWQQAVEAFGEARFLAAPALSGRIYHPDGIAFTYAQAGAIVERLTARYAAAGYGQGHRVALMLDNRPEHLLHKLALNRLGISVVPVNGDYRRAELVYLLEHSAADLAVVAAERAAQFKAALAESRHRPPVAAFEDEGPLPRALRPPPIPGPVTADVEASLLYTSGTTGRPKGCILSQRYELEAGEWYATAGGLMAFRDGGDRLWNPLPVYHLNSSVFSFFALMLRGNCQVQADRFHPRSWWQDMVANDITVVHYLGIIAPILLKQDPVPEEKAHRVRFGTGAGIEPQLHAAFEERFGFPLLEIWGMTEMVRAIVSSHEPRKVGTRAFGRARPGLEARVVDDSDRPLPDGTPGELVVRHSAATPRAGAFSGYLNDPEATERAWRGGWFHSGDVVTRDADGTFHFVDRKKNIIRRAGENIAAAEIEAWLQKHPAVLQVAVLAVPDSLREEEVMACVVPRDPAADRGALAETLFADCLANLAYYKAPGWFLFREALPTTGTQKIQKHALFAAGDDPTAGAYDFRDRKRRQH